MIFYICNRKRCAVCVNECSHTTDPEYAVNPDFDESRLVRIEATGDYWEKPDGSEGLRKYSEQIC